jgi:triosephosphate isomerase
MPFPVSIAAQNAHWERKGAYTGEISGPMLQELGVHWVLLGHSERRQYFGETNASVRKRADSLLQQGFHILFCIGETRKERESGLTETILAQQLTEAIPESNQGIANFLDGRVVFAYEPIWAIGTGLTATPQQAEEAQRFIRQLLYNHFGEKASTQTPILYGGSVIPENIQSLLSCPNVDGALVGGASLKAEHFLSLLKSAIEIL